MKQLEQGIRTIITALLLAFVSHFSGFEMAIFLGFAYIVNSLDNLKK